VADTVDGVAIDFANDTANLATTLKMEYAESKNALADVEEFVLDGDLTQAFTALKADHVRLVNLLRIELDEVTRLKRHTGNITMALQRLKEVLNEIRVES